MKKWLKRIGVGVGLLFLTFALFAGYFLYRVSYGMPFYETEIPEISFEEGKRSILLFSKTNGFNHKEAIVAGKKAFKKWRQWMIGFSMKQRMLEYLRWSSWPNLTR